MRPALPICGTETGALHQGKAIHFHFDFIFIFKKYRHFRSVYAPILTYGQACWIMNEKARSRVQAAEMTFLPTISGLTLLDKAKSAGIRESLNIESLLLRLERP